MKRSAARMWRAKEPVLGALAFGLVVLLGTAGSAQLPERLIKAKRGHALELAKLSDWCVDRKLFNDADRLLAVGRRLVPKITAILQRQKRLRELRLEIIKDDEKNKAHMAFWSSPAYETARADLRKRERKARQQVVASYLEIAGPQRTEDAKLADVALRLAFGVDPTSSDLALRAGKKRLNGFRSKRPGLAGVKLGKTVVGKATALEQLRGKVVLWRSFSL